jgi:hypothetical protein
MRRLGVMTITIFLCSLFFATGALAKSAYTSMDSRWAAMEQLRTPMQQSPEAQTPGVIELTPAGSKAMGTPHEFYGIAPRYEESDQQRTPVQQSPEMQTPGVIELAPSSGLR